MPTNPLDDPARLEALQAAGLLDTAAEEAFDRFTSLAAAVLQVPVALVSLVDADRQFFKSCVGLPEPWATARQTPLSHSFCQHAVISRDTLIIEDARQHPLLKENFAVQDLAVVAYLGVPLITSEGHALGSFCAIDSRPRRWSDREVGIIRDLAAAVMTEIELRAQMRVARREARNRQLAERRLLVEHAVSLALSESSDLQDASRRVMQAVREAYGCDWSALWVVNRDAGGLRCVETWVGTQVAAEPFHQLSRTTTLVPGAGLPGRVWETGKPAWIEDLESDANFPRRAAAIEAGLHGAFCFPILWDGEVVAVTEFLTREAQPADEPLLSMLEATSRQVEQFTRRKHVEDEVRRSQARLAAVVDTALDCIIGMDHQGRVTEWNPAAEQTFGYSRDQVLGQEMAGLIIPPALRERHRAGLSRYLATGDGPVLGRRFEITAVRSDGSEFPVELTIIRLPGEEPPAFTGHIRDITEAKRAQEARRMSEFRWQRLVEQSPLSTQIFAPDGTIRQVNAAWERLWGVTPADLPGYNILHDEQLVQRGMMPLFRRAFAGEAVTIEPIAYAVDRGRFAGQPRWCGAYVYPVKDDTGRIEEVVLVHNDVTEQRVVEEALRESEERLRAIFQQTEAGIAQVDLEGRFVLANDRYVQIVGRSRDELPTLRMQDITHPDDLPHNLALLQRAVSDGTPFVIEKRYVRPDGSHVWVSNSVSVTRGADGKPNGVVAATVDITARRRAETEREQLLESERAARLEAERASRMKDEFLATLSHELRTPLNAILGWSQVLASGSRDDDDLVKGLRTIERNARAQTQIIEDLLDMSRIVSGKVRLDVQRVDLGELVRLAVETAKPSAEAKGIRLQAVLDPHAGPVSGDPNRLQQVFWNLLSNAVKFTPKGGRIQVLLERLNSDVEVSVIDTGEGIRPEFLAHVFDRFRQGDSTTTRAHGGLGLGLSIVKQLVELHGGSVRAKSAGIDHGATFVVTLPLTVLHPEPEPAAERRHPRAPQSFVTLPDDCVEIAGVKVLVVDDEPDARALIKRLLDDCGAEVITAASAAEALDRVRTERPHVLVSDVGMPGEDGYSLIRRVRALGAEHGGNVPAVALTAYARSEDRTRSILAGFQMHVAKPIEASELIAVVATLAERSR